MTQASRPLHPSVAQCHVTPQLGFLGCTSPLSAGFNFHFLSRGGKKTLNELPEELS